MQNPREISGSFAVAPIPFDVSREPDIDFIINCVSYHTRIPKEYILGTYGTPAVVDARRKAFWLCRELTSRSYQDISLSFGREDPYTFYKSVNKANERRSKYPLFKAELEALKCAVEEAWIRRDS